MKLGLLKLPYFLALITTFVLIGCVGDKKPTKSARCDEGFAFDPVSRSCFAAGSTPVGTLTQLDVLENSGKNFVTLTYRDGNNDVANGCQVINDSPSKIELSSPRVYDFDARSQVLLTSIENVYNLIAPTALAQRDNARVAVSSLRSSTSLSVSIASRDSLILAARNLASAAMASPVPGAASSGSSLMGSVNNFEEYFSDLSNRCDCVAGVCQTVLVPRVDNIGAAGFRYSITEPSDGVSSFQNVSVNIQNINKRPVATSGHFGDPGPSVFNESITSTPSSYAFIPSTPLGVTFSSTYFFSDPVDRGVVTGCVPGVSFPGLCSYTPFSGNLSDVWDEFGVQRALLQDGEFATVDHFNIRYTSTFKGSMGNNTRIRYVAYQGLGYPGEGSVRVLSDAIGPIIEVTIIPNQTLNSVLVPQINSVFNDARLFVQAAPMFFDTTSQVSEVNLSGGLDAQDTFKYQVCNGMLCSEGAYTLRIVEQDDAPIVDVDNITTTPMEPLEDQIFTFHLAYLDSDDSLNATACSVTSTDLTEITVQSACTCVAGVCSASLRGTTNFHGTTSVDVTVTNNGEVSLVEEVDLFIKPVNDAPNVRETSLAEITVPFNETILENAGPTDLGAGKVYTSPQLILDRGDRTNANLESNQIMSMGVRITYQDDSPQDVIPMTSEHIKISFAGNDITPVDNDPLTELNVTFPAGMGPIVLTLTPDQFKMADPAFPPSQPLKVTLVLTDNGGVLDGGVDTRELHFLDLTVENVNFPPTITIGTNSSEPDLTVEANEGGEVYSPQIFITEGGESDEAFEPLNVWVDSDNHALLPPANITLHYNKLGTGLPHVSEVLPGPSETAQPLGDVADRSADFPLILRMKPVGSVPGTSNVTIFAEDSGGNISQSTFSLIIHPISAKHGGWNEIKAVSKKVFSSSQLDPDFKCLPTTSCSEEPNGLCQGTTAPNSAVIADQLHSIFFDTANRRCHLSTGTGVTNWQELNTFCPVTSKADNANCSGASCLGTAAPTINPTAIDQYFFDYQSRTCYRSEGLDVGDWVPYFPSEVTIGWNDFVLAGDGADTGVLINGWDIYRRRFDTPFDFSSPLASLTASERRYEDKTVNENTLYYYLVRPKDNKRSIATATNDVFSEIRVLTPPRNMAFVHRWMANQEVCGKMGKTLANEMVDPAKNFRCEFFGPGAEEDEPDIFYYDIGRDLLVDVAEAGCPFTRAPVCTSNGCIGVGEADAAWATTAGRVYYDRSSGMCYRSNGTDWVEIETAAIDATLANATQSVLLPPLVNVTQTKAASVCSTRDITISSDLDGIVNTFLPSRLEQMAYSAQPLGLSDNNVEQLERGLSLNSSSKCNGSSANGVSTNYTSGPIPPSSFYYSLPGTSSSGIRSVATGSIVIGDFQSTRACSSRYGIQDVYGNVSEWVTDTMTCSGSSCVGETPNFVITDQSLFISQDFYGFDGVIGPCRDIDANGVCDSFITPWLIQDKNFGANFFSFPMGLPIHRDFVFDFPSDPIAMSSLEIGPTSGITNAQLKRDVFKINSAAIEAATSNRGGLTTGGSYLDGDGSGRYTFELVPDESVLGVEASGGTLISEAPELEEMTFTAYHKGTAGNTISVVIVERSTAGGVPTVSVSGSSIVVSVQNGGDTGAAIRAEIENTTSSAALIGAVNLTTIGETAIFRGSGSGSFLTGGVDPVEPSRVDIGFRCMTAVEYQPPVPFDPNGPTWYPDDPEFNY